MSEITLGQLEGMFRNAAANIDKAIAPVIKATAYKVAATQKQNIPVRTGRTRDSIKATGPDGAAFGATTVEAVIGPRKPWAHTGRWIETGTVNQAPHVYIANSFEPHRAAHQNDILEAAARAFTG